MGKFFRGWRRKLGVVTLAMACVFMGGLVRSLSIGDRVTFFTGALTGESIRSENCYLAFASWKASRSSGPRPSFVEWDRYRLAKGNPRPDDDPGIEYRFRCLVFGFGKSSGGMSLTQANRFCFLSYWAAILPLTLLSAYLLLTKPRSSTKDKSSESLSSDFYPKRRRKAGLVTFVLACVFIGGWARSFNFADRCDISDEIHQRIYFCESRNGSIRWMCYELPDVGSDTEPEDDENDQDLDMRNDENVVVVIPTYRGWLVTSRSDQPSHFVTDDHPDSGIRLRFRFMGFGSGDITSIDGSKSALGSIWFVPYWSIVIPLTLLSAYLLLLSKPRRANMSGALIL
jgi:hypothetical protein